MTEASLHDLPPHHLYRIEVRADRWRWSTHSSAKACRELQTTAQALHASGEVWRLVSNTRDSIVTCDPAKCSWRAAWTRAYRTATGCSSVWHHAESPAARTPWTPKELEAIARMFGEGLSDDEISARLIVRSTEAVAKRRHALGLLRKRA